MYLNEQENIFLAEFRDALLPDLMSGKSVFNNFTVPKGAVFLYP